MGAAFFFPSTLLPAKERILETMNSWSQYVSECSKGATFPTIRCIFSDTTPLGTMLNPSSSYNHEECCLQMGKAIVLLAWEI